MNGSPVLLWTAIFLVLVWFGLLHALLDRLKSRHFEKYLQLGMPRPLWNRSVKPGWATFRFLFTREHKALEDRILSVLSDASVAVFALYAILFLFL